jgi:hypothetical protein
MKKIENLVGFSQEEIWEIIEEDWKYIVPQERIKEVDFIITSCAKAIKRAEKGDFSAPQGFLFPIDDDDNIERQVNTYNKISDNIAQAYQTNDIFTLIDMMMSYGIIYHRKYRKPFSLKLVPTDRKGGEKNVYSRI